MGRGHRPRIHVPRPVVPATALAMLTCLLALVVACSSTPGPASTQAATFAATPAATLASQPPASPRVSPSHGSACQPVATDGAAAVPLASTSVHGWWQDRVFYEVFVRSFADSNGDGIGDLPGLLQHLDQLNDGDPATTTDLGVSALWLMPIFPAASYHGYDVTDYRSVNPDYGTLDDLRAVIAAAHQRGMAVILDMPFNHTSNQDPWFVDAETPGSAHDDWYVWADRPEGSNWFPDGDRYYYAAFGADMPDLNLRNPAVTAELTATARYWLEDVGVDGFRMDAAKYLVEDGSVTQNTPETHAWWQALRTNLEATDPGAFLLGEVWDTPQESSSYVPDDLDMTFDFGLSGVYVATAGSASASAQGRSLTKITGLYPTDGLGTFLTNHDMDRVASVLGDPAKLRVAAGLLLSGPGVPFVYYGEEIGLTGQKPDERIRAPMRWDASEPTFGFSTGTPWEAVTDDLPGVNVAEESADPCSLLSWYRTLIGVRAAHPVLAEGGYQTLTSSSDAVLAELRTSATETLLVVINTSGAAVSGEQLSLDSGPFVGAAPTARLVLGSGTPAAPQPTAAGGFSGYVPFPTLPADSVSIVSLTP
jgi:alpha-amylase